MNCKLVRTHISDKGCFGALTTGQRDLYIAEHCYSQVDGTNAPKVPCGTYRCVRGLHRLEGMLNSFETFELKDVPGHSNILIHWGNYPQKDSDGCLLIGHSLFMEAVNPYVGNSRQAFRDFMEMQDGCNEFQLEIV